jgi:hypothetical protein
MKFFDWLTGTKRPAAGVPAKTPAEVRADLLAVNRPTAPFIVRDGATENVDLVAEWRIGPAANPGKSRSAGPMGSRSRAVLARFTATIFRPRKSKHLCRMPRPKPDGFGGMFPSGNFRSSRRDMVAREPVAGRKCVAVLNESGARRDGSDSVSVPMAASRRLRRYRQHVEWLLRGDKLPSPGR